MEQLHSLFTGIRGALDGLLTCPCDELVALTAAAQSAAADTAQAEDYDGREGQRQEARQQLLELQWSSISPLVVELVHVFVSKGAVLWLRALVAVLADRDAARTGHPQSVVTSTRKYAACVMDSACRVQAPHGPETVRLLLELGAFPDEAAVWQAVDGGNMATAALLLGRRNIPAEAALLAVVTEGRAEDARQMLYARLVIGPDQPPDAPTRHFLDACQEGRLGDARRLLGSGAVLPSERLVDAVCNLYGPWKADLGIHRVAAASLLFEHGACPTADMLRLACEQGFQDVVKLLLDQGSPPGALLAMEVACHRGHAAVVQTLLDYGTEASPDALSTACRAGWPDVARLLRVHSAGTDVGACDAVPIHVAG